jgi:predicted nuclease of restriction endonuclease-like (RecB) superfamily
MIRMDFKSLKQGIKAISDSLRQNAIVAVNTHLTIKNWLIGFYIVEYEQNGEDKAKYGTKLLQNLANEFDEEGLSYRNLKLYRQFYNCYPQIGTYVPQFFEKYFGKILQSPIAELKNTENRILQSLIAELKNAENRIGQSPIAQLQNTENRIGQSPIAQLQNTENRIGQSPIAQLQNAENPIVQSLIAELKNTENRIVQSLIAELKNTENRIGQSPIAQLPDTENPIVQSPISQLGNEKRETLKSIPVEKLLKKLSYTHLTLLFPIEEPLKRLFYEVECIKGGWSVRELKRQIDSLYFERSGMSRNPALLSKLVQENSEAGTMLDTIKSPFIFEFLGLKSKDVVYESDLERALIEHLEEFLMELGYGFCFEARQKRIIIGDEYYFCDLVFYHRLLKCHVLIEIKVGSFSPEHIGQLKTYINYYRKEIMQPDDNPPVGILLVTNKNNALVEYATADSDRDIFISKYVLELPTKEQLIRFVNEEISKL